MAVSTIQWMGGKKDPKLPLREGLLHKANT